MNILSVFLMAPAQGGQQSNPMASLIMLVLIIAIFYFFMIRPQMKKQKEVRAFRDSLQKGDKVLTVGGIYGRITEVKETTVLLEISNGVIIKVDKAGLIKDSSDVNADQPK
jgi:preprotein translocase subunit YajC